MKNFTKKLGMLGIFICACGHIQAMSYDECRFWKALANKNATLAKNITAAGHIDVNFRDKGILAIEHATYLGAVDVVEAMFRSGNLLINERSSVNGRAAIHVAAFRKQLEMVKWLVEHGADVNILDNCAEPPLYFSDADESGEITKYLIEHGADESKKKGNIKRLGMKPMHVAIYFNDVIILRRMLEDGANPNVTKTYRLDYFIHAFLDMVRFSGLESGIINTELVENTISMLRTKYTSNEVTALQYAATVNRPACAWLLLEHGAKIDHEAFYRAQYKENFAVTSMLFRYVNKLADFPLLYAIEFGDISIVYKMLQEGADPNAAGEVDKNIYTPLSLAAKHDKPGIVALLLQYGARPCCKIMPADNGLSPLLTAIASKSISSLRILLRANIGYSLSQEFMSVLFFTASATPDCNALATLYEFYPSVNFNTLSLNGISIFTSVAATISCFIDEGEVNESRFFSYVECLNFLSHNGADINLRSTNGISTNDIIQYVIDRLEISGGHQNWIRALRTIHGFTPRPRIMMNRSSFKTGNNLAM